MQNRVSQQFGNYRLLHLLGKGGFAEVYLGEHVHMQSKAAVKVLYGPLIANEAQHCLQEARTLASLVHPHIVGIKECDIQENIPFFIMDYAPNGTLRQRHAKGQPVPLETIVSYVLQVASALQYAHDRHIVHRDLKPENMLIDGNNQILLSDFGIAVLTVSSHSSVSQGPAGTYFYMAPEQITGKAVPASDQYALGITVYEWLCGEVPFVGSAAEITAKHLHVPPPPFRDKGRIIEPQVEAVIRRALEKNPQQRFASVQEFALALQSSSVAQQRNNVSLQLPGSQGSVVISPPDQALEFTKASIFPPLPVLSHDTPRITPQVGIAPTNPQQTPPIYQNTPYSPYAPTEPAGPYRQPPVPVQPPPPSPQLRKKGTPYLVTALISLLLLLVIGIGTIFAVLKNIPSLTGLNTGLGSARTTFTPTPTATPTPNSPGITWTVQDSGVSNNLGGVAWSGMQFVAVGGGTNLTSSDGHKWAIQNSGTSEFLHSVVWSDTDKLFVAVGDSGTILTSLDGDNWTTQNSGTSQTLYRVIWSGTRFVAVGDSGTILTSLDGDNWKSQNSGTSQTLYGVAWLGAQFVVVGGSGTVLTSTNEDKWTAQNSDTSSDLYSILWSNTDKLFVAGGYGTILTSPDGYTWTSRSLPALDAIVGIVSSGTRLVAVGDFGGYAGYGANSAGAGAIYTSPDGRIWTLQEHDSVYGFFYQFAGIVWSDTQFVIVGDSGTILTSP